MGLRLIGLFLFSCLQLPIIEGKMCKRNLNKIHIERQQKILENAVEDDLLKTKEKFNMLANETKEAMKNLRSYIESALIRAR